MDDHMFGCYHCHAQMDELKDLVAHCKSEHADVSANFSFSYFVKTKNIYQLIHLKYPVSHIPEDCHIYLQNGKLILRLCESPDQGTAEVHSSDTHPTKYRKLSSTPTKCTTSDPICPQDVVHTPLDDLGEIMFTSEDSDLNETLPYTFHLNEN